MPQSRISSWSGPFASLGADDRSVVTQLVLSGGAVVATSMQIAERLGRARLIALLRSQGTDRIIGVASLKEPARGYRVGRFADAGVPIAGFETAPELGYVVVAEDIRRKGHSERLVGLMLNEVAEAVYATTDNDYMKKTLVKSGFAAVGGEWEGERGMLSLWTYVPVAAERDVPHEPSRG